MDNRLIEDLKGKSKTELYAIIDNLISENNELGDQLEFEQNKIRALSQFRTTHSIGEYLRTILYGMPIKNTSAMRLVMLENDLFNEKISTGVGTDFEKFHYLDEQVGEQLGGKNILEIADTSKIHNFVFSPEKIYPRSIYAFPLVLSQKKIGFLWVADQQVKSYTHREVEHLTKMAAEFELAFGYLSNLLHEKQIEAIHMGAFESNEDPMIVVNPLQEIVFYNPAARDHLQLQINNTEMVTGPGAALKKCLQEKENVFSISIEGVDFEARGRDVDISGGKPYRLYRFINKTREAARNAFLAEIVNTISANISSELETVRGYISLTRGLGQITPKQEEYLEKIATGSERIIRKLQDLLSINRFKADSFLCLSEFDLKPLINDVARLFTPVFTQKQLSLKMVLPEAEIKILSDRGLLEQIILNLFETSVQDAPLGGEIKIEISRGDGQIQLRIMDDGAGISKPDIHAILENAVTMGKYQNLSIAKAITDLLLGKLSIEGQPGEGKKVTVTIPEK